MTVSMNGEHPFGFRSFIIGETSLLLVTVAFYYTVCLLENAL
jgi:hypothetical protein